MKKIYIEEQLVLYHFPSNNEERLGHNIYGVIEGKRALVIDTGYEQHFRQVIKDLEDQGIAIVKVVPSSFRPDHVDGLFLLKKPKIYGLEASKKTIEAYYDPEDRPHLSPQKVLKTKAVIEFGAYRLQVISGPGPSDCGVMININDKYLHVGDLYMMTDTSQEVLPHVMWAGVKDHIRSLKEVSKSSCAQLLLAHGPSPIGLEQAQVGIKDRLAYLDAIRRSYNKCSLEEALEGMSQPFVFHKWRKEIQ